MPANLGIYADKAKAPRGVIYAIGPSPKDGDTIWAGTDDGLVQVTRDGGRSWKNVTPPEMTAVEQGDADRRVALRRRARRTSPCRASAWTT